jgi:hypothetical protein
VFISKRQALGKVLLCKLGSRHIANRAFFRRFVPLVYIAAYCANKLFHYFTPYGII